MSVVIGIDPGNEGGIAILQVGGPVCGVRRMPTLKGKRETIDLATLEIILTVDADVQLVCVEQIQPMGMPNGAVGVAALMKACGAIWGLCHALRLPYEEVQPRTWQKLLIGVPHDHAPKGATEAVKATYRKAWKHEIMNAARRRWPNADLIGSTHPSAKESSGISDALWICEYARLRVMGGAKITA